MSINKFSNPFRILLLLLVISTAIACGSNEQKTSEQPKEPAHKEQEANKATLTEEQLKAVGVELGSIENKQLTASLKANGVLQVPNQNKASVNSLYSGVIKSLLVQPGERVRKGQTIATVSNPEFIQVQSQYLNTISQIGLAQLEVKRQEELNAGNAGALKNLQSAQTQLRTLTTTRNTLEQQIRLMGVNPGSLSNGKLISVLAIASPINGVISSVMVKMGSYVDLATPVAEIVDNSQLHLDLFVYEKDLGKLKDDQQIHFTLTNNPGKEYDAQIYSLGSSFEGESKAVTVHAKVQGDKTGLIDGMNITAVISLDKATVPAVPTEAIVNFQGQDYVFMTVKEDSNHVHDEKEKGLTFERIAVAKGTTDVGYTEITPLKQIPANASIVVKGAFFVHAKMTSGGEEEHGH